MSRILSLIICLFLFAGVKPKAYGANSDPTAKNPLSCEIIESHEEELESDAEKILIHLTYRNKPQKITLTFKNTFLSYEKVKKLLRPPICYKIFL